MKVLISKSILLAFALLAATIPGTSNNITKGKQEFIKKIEKSFSINASGQVDLSNKHGKVEVKTWNQNKVDIEVSIIVNARSESAANAVFDRIVIDFTNNSNYVRAATSISSKSKSLWTSGNKTDYEINYLVKMPRSCNLKLANKYGHSFVENIDGRLEADIKYGDLNTADIGGELKLILGYGNGKLGETGKADFDIKYSKLHLKAADNIDIESKYSQMYFGETGDMDVNSKYDTYELGTVSRLKGDGKYDNYTIEAIGSIDLAARYTQLKIDRLEEAAYVELEYGGFRVKELSSKFRSVDLKGKHTEFKIGVESGAQFSLDASVEHGSVRYPDNMEVTKDIKRHTSHTVEGYKGSANTKSRIKVESRYGSVKIYE